MLTPDLSSNFADDQIVIGENIAQHLGIQFDGLTHDEIIFPQELKVAGSFTAESNACNASICSIACIQIQKTFQNLHLIKNLFFEIYKTFTKINH